MKRSKLSKFFRIIAFSDWRSQDFEYLEAAVQNIPNVNLFIYGGDDLNRLIEFEIILERIIKRTSEKKLLFVAGNDDVPPEKRELSERKWAHDLEIEPFYLGNYAFFGNEGSVDGLGFHQKNESQVAAQLQKQKRQASKHFQKRKFYPIIISHAPPYGILDSAIRHSSDGLARHIGSTALRKFTEKQQVPLTICGHVHLWGGKIEKLTNGNQILNIASHDHTSADGRLAIIDLFSSGEIEINLYSLYNWFSTHELSRLSQVGWRRFHQLRANGIESLRDIHEGNFRQLLVKGAGSSLVKIWLKQAELFREEIEAFERDSYEKSKPRFSIVFSEKMNFLRKEHFIVWDIETDLTQTHIWIIGALDTKNGEFKQFFNLNDEHELLDEFLEWMDSKNSAQLLSYSGSRLEPRVVVNSLNKYGLGDRLNLNNRDIDLCSRLRYGCATTAPTLQLKELASSLGFNYRHPDIDGMYVGSVFSEYLESGKEPEDLNEILQYNEDDVLSTTHVLNIIKNGYEKTL